MTVNPYASPPDDPQLRRPKRRFLPSTLNDWWFVSLGALWSLIVKLVELFSGDLLQNLARLLR